MKAFAETEKAVKLEWTIHFEESEKARTTFVWFPKSQISNGKVSQWIFGKKLEEVETIFYARQFCTHELRDAEGNSVEVAWDERTQKQAVDFENTIRKSFGRLFA